MIRRLLVCSVSFLLAITCLFAANDERVLGKWTTKDKNGSPESEVIIYKVGDGYNCKVTRLLGKFADFDNPLCKGCPGEYKDQPILGIDVIKGMKYDGEKFTGKVLSPNMAKIFKMTMEVDPKDSDILIVKGFWGPFSETQRWTRIK